MRTVHTIKELRAVIRSYRTQGKRVGLVPTMGNLHEGHLALVRRALEASDVVVTSIFVNPMQFGAGEDLDAYPRTLAEDQRKLEAEGNSLLFAPNVQEVYPDGLARQLSRLRCLPVVTTAPTGFNITTPCGVSPPGFVRARMSPPSRP